MGVLHLCLHLFLSLMSGLHVLLGLISITEPMEGTPSGAEPGKEARVGGVARGDAGCGVARAEDARER